MNTKFPLKNATEDLSIKSSPLHRDMQITQGINTFLTDQDRLVNITVLKPTECCLSTPPHWKEERASEPESKATSGQEAVPPVLPGSFSWTGTALQDRKCTWAPRTLNSGQFQRKRRKDEF